MVEHLEKNQINVLSWPSKLPNLNPVASVNGHIMTKCMYKHDFRSRNHDLLESINEAFNNRKLY